MGLEHLVKELGVSLRKMRTITVFEVWLEGLCYLVGGGSGCCVNYQSEGLGMKQEGLLTTSASD